MKGDDFVILVGDGAAGFDQVGGQRGGSMSINGEQVNLTSKDSGGWRELLTAGGGNKSVSVSVSGVWLSETEQETVRGLALSGNVEDYQIDDGAEVIEAGFQTTSFELAGDQGAEQTYSFTLESADQPTVT